jgi:hypothetical protein
LRGALPGCVPLWRRHPTLVDDRPRTTESDVGKPHRLEEGLEEEA